MELLLMAIGVRSDVYYLCKNNMIIPTLMFFGAAFMTKLNSSAKRKLYLGILVVAWFVVVQIHRDLLDWRIHPYSWFLSTYLMAYPFAASAEDGEKAIGLKLYGGFFLAASCILVCYGVLLLTNNVPEEYSTNIYYHEGSRFALMSNPNISGSILMIAVVFSLTIFLRAEKRWMIYASFFGGCVFFINMVLTNCRTATLITCAIIGGCVFFYFFSGGWKRFWISFLAACIFIVGLFFVSQKVYSSYKDFLIVKFTQQIEELSEPSPTVPDSSNPDSEYTSSSEDVSAATAGLPSAIFSIPRGTLLSHVESDISKYGGLITLINLSNERRTFANQLGTLSGRTEIWWAALRSIREDPSILIWGCEHTGETISQYLTEYMGHTHNSWAEITLSLGAPGAVISLIYTWIAIWNSMVLLLSKLVPMWKKSIALLTLGILIAGFMEPFIFFTNQSFHFFDFTFFLCLGYVRVWVEALPREFRTKKLFCFRITSKNMAEHNTIE